jgi:hypothetical protein
MNKDQIVHLINDELLLYLDGELDSAAAESTRRHLDSCWSCRMQAARIQSAILEYARERERSAIVEPPSPWKDLSGDFSRVHDSVPSASLLQRIRTGAFFRNGRVAILAVVATAMAAIAWFTLAHAPEPRKSAVETVRGTASEPAIIPSGPPADLPSAPLHAPRTQGKPVGVHEELAVVGELHRLKADLGEPIELERTEDDRLILNASGLDTEQAQGIRHALARFPELTIHFSEPKAIDGARAVGSSVPMTRRPVAFEPELLQYTRGRESMQQLANETLDASDQVTMYAHALARLDHRFGASESAMDTEDLVLLAQIRTDYRTSARRAAKLLQTLMEPIFVTLGIESADVPREDLLETALELDRLLNAAFAGAQSDLDDKQLYSALRARMTQIAEFLR